MPGASWMSPTRWHRAEQPIPTALTDPDIADALNDLDPLIGEVADHKN